MMIPVSQALALGFAFGWLLHKAGLASTARIIGVYRLRDLAVLQFMLAALVVAAVGIQAAADLGLARPLPVPPTFVLANLVGGIVFGAGMATAGCCPGTIVAEAGEGRLDALTAGIGGLLAGAIAFSQLQPALMPLLTRFGDHGRVTFFTLIPANPWLILLVFVQIAGLALLLTGRAQRPSDEE